MPRLRGLRGAVGRPVQGGSMRIQWRPVALLPALVAGLISGCAFAPLVPWHSTVRAGPPAPPPGKAQVFIVRPAGDGRRVKADVTCDGRALGSTAPKRFVYAPVDPGPHLFVTQGEDANGLPIVLEAGRTYYFEQTIPVFPRSRPNLVRLRDAAGMRKLRKCSLSPESGLQP